MSIFITAPHIDFCWYIDFISSHEHIARRCFEHLSDVNETLSNNIIAVHKKAMNDER